MFQSHPGSDLGGLPSQQMELGRPVGHVGQWWDGAVDDCYVGSDLDLSRSERFGGGQQGLPYPVRLPAAPVSGPPVLEQLDLTVDQAEVVADPSHLRQAVGCLRCVEITDGEA